MAKREIPISSLAAKPVGQRHVVAETSKDVVAETSKDVVAETSKDVVTETSKDIVAETSKDVVAEASKDVADRSSRANPCIPSCGNETSLLSSNDATDTLWPKGRYPHSQIFPLTADPPQ